MAADYFDWNVTICLLVICAAIIPAGVNINHMSSQVKVAVEDEQKKVLWIPFAGNNSATTSI